MPREFYNSSGEPEDPTWVADFEKRSKDCLATESVNDQQIKELMERINFNDLRQIFQRIYSLSTNDQGSVNFVGPNDFFVRHTSDNSKNTLATYAGPTNDITIDRLKLPNFLGGGLYSKFSGRLFDIDILRGIIHEEIHAASYQRHQGIREEESGIINGTAFAGIEQTGYSLKSIRRKRVGKAIKQKGLLELFNEGVTEHMADQILKEYIRNHKEFATTAELDSYQTELETNNERGYKVPIAMVTIMVDKIRQYSGIDSEYVWQSLFRSMIEGLDLTDRETANLIEECLPPGFIYRLTKADTDKKCEKLIAELKKYDLSKNPTLRQKLLSDLTRATSKKSL